MGQTLVKVIQALECKHCSEYVFNACHVNSRCCGDFCQCEVETKEIELEHEDRRCCLC